MNLNSKLSRWFLSMLVIMLVACQPTPTPTPVTTSSPIPTLIPLTDTPIPPSPTQTNVPTIIPTIPATVSELAGAELPPGFSILKFAEGYRPTAYACYALGHLYRTSTDSSIY